MSLRCYSFRNTASRKSSQISSEWIPSSSCQWNIILRPLMFNSVLCVQFLFYRTITYTSAAYDRMTVLPALRRSSLLIWQPIPPRWCGWDGLQRFVQGHNVFLLRWERVCVFSTSICDSWHNYVLLERDWKLCFSSFLTMLFFYRKPLYGNYPNGYRYFQTQVPRFQCSPCIPSAFLYLAGFEENLHIN